MEDRSRRRRRMPGTVGAVAAPGILVSLGILAALATLAAPAPALAQDGAGETSEASPPPPEGSGTTASPWSEPAERPWEAPPVALPRIAGPVVLDGMPDEAAWEAVPPVPVVMHWPTFRGRMTERTEIRIAYDDEHLWVAGRFWDSEPGEIRENSLYRDGWNGDDAFDLVIDSFDDDETALKFTTTPTGILEDQAIANDAQPGGGARPINVDWDTFWDVATEVTDRGWFTEMRIPFSSLGFEPEGDRVVMGIIASRYIVRKQERHIFPAIPPEWSLAAFKPSRARDVALRGVERPPPLYFTPYLLAGLDRTGEANAGPGAPSGPPAELTREVGFDLKYGLSPNLTLDVTVNTDFAQVESDAERVNLSRFALFFPEKRRFFQERASIFRFDLGEEGRLFHSRTIGLTEGGEPLRILGGARLAGRIGAWDVGILDMQVAGSGGDGAGEDPGENDGVLRVRRSVLNDRSTAGALLTTRARTDGSLDASYGTDASLNLFGDDFLRLQWAQTRGPDTREAFREARAEDGGPGFLDRSALRLFWERRSIEGLGYLLDVARSGPGYQPALGFEEREDFTGFQGRLSYGLRPAGKSAVSRHQAYLTGRVFLDNGDGGVESALGRLRWAGTFRNGNFLNFALNFEYERLAERLELDESVAVPAGRYFGPNLFGVFRTSNGNPLRLETVLHVGTFLDGWRTRLDLGPSWTLSPHLSLGLEYGLNRLFFPTRGEDLAADIARLRVRGALDTKLSAQAFLQYNRAADRFAGNVRLRYRLAEGRELFLVYDEAREAGRSGQGSDGIGRTDRRLLLKWAWTLRP